MKLSHQQGLIEVEKKVTEKSKVDQCHQKLFLVPRNKGNNPVTNHFGGAFNTGASKTKRMKGEKWLVDFCKQVKRCQKNSFVLESSTLQLPNNTTKCFAILFTIHSGLGP